jgi:hypothetical protein
VLLCLTASALLLQRLPANVPADGGRLVRVAGIVALTLGFVLSLKLLNLWLALAGLLTALPLWLGERRYHLIALLALSIPLLGWLGIELALGLRLPD